MKIDEKNKQRVQYSTLKRGPQNGPIVYLLECEAICLTPRTGPVLGPVLGPILGRVVGSGLETKAGWPSLRCASHSNLKNMSDLSKCQVGIFFQWVDYVKQAAPEGKTILWVNCDETSIGYAFPRLRGNVVRGFRKRAATEKGIQKNEMRGSITYLTFSRDRGEVQSLLPQILLGNKRCFTPALLQAVREHMPPNVHVMRENSS